MAFGPDEKMQRAMEKRRAVCAEFRDLMESRPELSQADIARMVDVQRASVHKYLHGKTTPSRRVMNALRAGLRDKARHESGEIRMGDQDPPMQMVERQVIQALRQIEPAMKRSRMAAAVRDMLLAAGQPVQYRARPPEDSHGSVSELERAVLATESAARDELLRSEQEAGGGQRELPKHPPGGAKTTDQPGGSEGSRTQYY